MDVEASKQDIPAGFVIPTHESTIKKSNIEEEDNTEFWAESEEGEDFGGSNTDLDLEEDDDDTQSVNDEVHDAAE